ncbi:hypothetical protein HXX76_000591 [Chlamydomonas incerta]|uniref:Uncharacterized protein n=1 Tax=Chlamydomonas incerta TaxID=51695 RepID=A0A836B338_CHLIN|nr:hypothetical protein HXX76_000591 [Chlamydomonas incerta]|eukprot:KAG2445988.1 hypothetical protein HXX76_000591 [Chlamydomonas incerta]
MRQRALPPFNLPFPLHPRGKAAMGVAGYNEAAAKAAAKAEERAQKQQQLREELKADTPRYKQQLAVDAARKRQQRGAAKGAGMGTHCIGDYSGRATSSGCEQAKCLCQGTWHRAKGDERSCLMRCHNN